jgi:hypothetical protein
VPLLDDDDVDQVVDEYRLLSAALPPDPNAAWLSVDLTRSVLNSSHAFCKRENQS